MKRIVIFLVGLLLAVVAVLAGCGSAEDAVETTTTTTTTTESATGTTTSVIPAAAVSYCVTCHTDKAMLQANCPEETTAEAESSGEG